MTVSRVAEPAVPPVWILLCSLNESLTLSNCHSNGGSTHVPAAGCTTVHPGMPPLKLSPNKSVAGAAWTGPFAARISSRAVEMEVTRRNEAEAGGVFILIMAKGFTTH